MRIIKMLTENQVPLNKKDPIYWYYSKFELFIGQSFLVNPDVLLYNSYKYIDRDLAIYCALASGRPLSEYIAHGTLDLELIKSSIDPRSHLYDKSLLPVKDEKIQFIYENPQILH